MAEELQQVTKEPQQGPAVPTVMKELQQVTTKNRRK